MSEFFDMMIVVGIFGMSIGAVGLVFMALTFGMQRLERRRAARELWKGFELDRPRLKDLAARVVADMMMDGQRVEPDMSWLVDKRLPPGIILHFKDQTHGPYTIIIQLGAQ